MLSDTRTVVTTATPPALGLVLVGVLSLCWGFNWPVMKVVVTEVPPWTFRAASTGVGGAILLFGTWLSRRRLVPTRHEMPHLLLASMLNITLWMLLSAYAVGLMNAGRAAIVAYTMPVWSILLSAIILGERLTARRIAGVVLGLSGMALLLRDDFRDIGASPLGTLLMTGAAFCWGAGTVVVKVGRIGLSTIALAGWQMLLAAIPLTIGAAVLDDFDVSGIGLWPALGVVYNMLIGSALCVWIWFRIVALYSAGVAAISTLLIPVVGIFGGALLLGEHVGLAEIVALALVLAALAVVHGYLPPSARTPD
ncbi:MAG: EamA family transporter [Rhodospirillaceae bacterium]|nr:EamA family transporter [Rhodospirillaceae bacterium]